MNVTQVAVRRPNRWDLPFGEDMTDQVVDQLMTICPFSQMDEGAFSKAVSLRGILKNDCRVRAYEVGDIVIRQGDYGHSAFFVLEGEATVSLANLPPDILGRQTTKKKGWFESFSQLWTNSRVAEARASVSAQVGPTQVRMHGDEARVFLQDIPRILQPNQTAAIHQGELFGEIAALTRTPRSATVLATEPCKLLEIRWQGFRDILKRDSAFTDTCGSTLSAPQLATSFASNRIFV